MTTAVTILTGGDGLYDRDADIKQFDASKIGVKGLVDSGVTLIPSFFVRPPTRISDLKRRHTSPELSDIIPTIDLSGADTSDRAAVVELMARASRELGFFQIVNHGIPVEVLDRMVASVKAFHEQPNEVKSRFYSTDLNAGVSFFSNLDLHRTKSASWRDTFQVRLSPNPPELEEIPEIYREEVVKWNQQSIRLGEVLMGLLCEGLGLNTNKLKDMNCSKKRVLASHYYPSCPQPELTVGINAHTDPSFITILLQDHVGGLQIKHGDNWLDVKPVNGALVINIGVALQIMSNDEYMSVEHRVLANPFPEPRISIAAFFIPHDKEILYGPFSELVSPEKPALFRHFNSSDFLCKCFLSKESDGKSLVNYYRL